MNKNIFFTMILIIATAFFIPVIAEHMPYFNQTTTEFLLYSLWLGFVWMTYQQIRG